MKRALAAACSAAWLLAGCAALQQPQTDEGTCRAQADNDPKVRQLLMKATGNPHFLLEGQDQIYAARQDATTACLRSRGVIPGGGVERRKVL